MLRYARFTLGCPWDGSVCANAAAAGHLHVLGWLREEGCPWDKETSDWAVYDLEMLRWVRENGCEWTAETRDKADDYFMYADDFGNLVSPNQSEDEDGYDSESADD